MNAASSIRIKTKLKIFKGYPDFTPFAGVFFLLLIFFMMGSSFIQVSGIPVELPEAQVSGSFGVKKFVVTIDSYSKIYFNDLAIPGMDILKEKLMEMVAAHPENDKPPTIVIRADSKAPFGVVAKLMSLAEDLRINAFVLTVPPAAPKDTKSVETDVEK